LEHTECPSCSGTRITIGNVGAALNAAFDAKGITAISSTQRLYRLNEVTVTVQKVAPAPVGNRQKSYAERNPGAPVTVIR